MVKKKIETETDVQIFLPPRKVSFIAVGESIPPVNIVELLKLCC